MFNNVHYGIRMSGSDNMLYGNILYQNNGANTVFDGEHIQAYDEGTNCWNSTSYGNYWCDLLDPDANTDGIVDNPYQLDGSNSSRDELPLSLGLSIIDPASGSCNNTGSVTVEWAIADLLEMWDHYAYSTDSTTWTNTTETSQTFQLDDGVHTVFVRAYDSLGNYNGTSVTIIVDTIAPGLEITSPVNGAYISTGSVTVRVTGWDAMWWTDHFAYSTDGSTWTHKEEPYHTFALADGEHTIYVRAYDNAGNFNQASVTFTVDTTAPVLSITSPAASSYNNTGSVTVIWEGSDATSGIDHYAYSTDGTNWTNTTALNHLFSFLEGERTVFVRAYDLAGHVNETSVTFTMDSTDPVLDITSPSNGSYNSTGSVTVSWTGSDATSGIDHFAYSTDGSTWTDTTGPSHTFAPADGRHTVYVRVYDRAGNYEEKSVTFFVDTVAPFIQIITPAADSYFNTVNTYVIWDAGDSTSGMHHFAYSTDGTNWTNTTDWEIPFTFPEGEWTIYVRAYDQVGHMNETSVTFTVDTTDPELEITYPVNGSYNNFGCGSIDWDVSDDNLATVFLRFNNGTWINVTILNSYSRGSFIEGPLTMYLNATDLAGNYNLTSITIIVDTVDPSVSITYPTVDSYVNTGSINVTWTGSDATSGIDDYLYSTDGTTWTDTTDLNHVFTFAGGEHTVFVRAYDKAGNMNVTSVIFTVDTVVPDISIIAPAEGWYDTTGNVAMSWNGSDVTSGIDRFAYSTDGMTWTDTDDLNHTFPLADGEHTIYVRTYDKAGNFNQSGVTFTVDTTAPVLIITHPANGSYNSTGNVTVIWEGSDATSGIDRYTFSTDGTTWTNTTGLNHTFSFTDGEHTVHVRAYDVAGNFNQTNVTVTVDTEAPTLEVTSPFNDSLLSSSTVQVNWTAADDRGIAHFLIKVDGGNWTYVGSGNLSWAFEGLSDGDHAVAVEVIDLAGNHVTDEVSFLVDTVAPTATGSPSGEDVALGAVMTVTFSEAMDVGNVSITVNGVAAIIAWNGSVATVAGDWEYDTEYVIMVTGSDLAGNAMEGMTFSFVTEEQLITVSGVLLDDEGNPVANANISVNGTMVAITGENGSYSFQLTPGECLVAISAEGYEDQTLSLTMGDEPTSLEVEMHAAQEASDGSLWWLSLVMIAVIVGLLYMIRRKL